MMILGIGARVVAALNGCDTRLLSSLRGPFVLLNLGCFLRVTLQTATDAHPVFFGLVGVSGLLEVAALAWWGGHLVAVMREGWRAETAVCGRAAAAASAPPPRIEAEHTVADVLRWHARGEAILVRHGFAAIGNPVLRRTVARVTTLRQAAALRSVDLDRLLRDLNAPALTD